MNKYNLPDFFIDNNISSIFHHIYPKLRGIFLKEHKRQLRSNEQVFFKVKITSNSTNHSHCSILGFYKYYHFFLTAWDFFLR